MVLSPSAVLTWVPLDRHRSPCPPRPLLESGDASAAPRDRRPIALAIPAERSASSQPLYYIRRENCPNHAKILNIFLKIVSWGPNPGVTVLSPCPAKKER